MSATATGMPSVTPTATGTPGPTAIRGSTMEAEAGATGRLVPLLLLTLLLAAVPLGRRLTARRTD